MALLQKDDYTFLKCSKESIVSNLKNLSIKIVEKGYNYGTVADEAGVDRNTISSAIDGKYRPSYKVMNALYYVLELTPDEAVDICFAKDLRSAKD